MTDSIDISRCLVKVIFCAVLIHPFLPTLAFSPAPSVNPSLFPQAVCPWPHRLRAQRKYLPGPNANVHSSLVGDQVHAMHTGHDSDIAGFVADGRRAFLASAANRYTCWLAGF